MRISELITWKVGKWELKFADLDGLLSARLDQVGNLEMMMSLGKSDQGLYQGVVCWNLKVAIQPLILDCWFEFGTEYRVEIGC